MPEHHEVRALWTDHLQRTSTWNSDRADAVRDQLVARVTAELHHQPELAATLRAELRNSPEDDDYRSFLYSVLVPRHRLAIEDPDAFRAHPEIAMTAEQMPIRLSAALVRVTMFPRVEENELAKYTATWFGGRPLAPPGDVWPLSTDDTPLTHVVQVSLGDDNWEYVPDSIGLPTHGLLQIFHDLETYGEPEDAGAQAWHVRWLDVDEDGIEELTPLAYPEDLPTPGRIPPDAARVSPMATIPSILDFHDDDPATQARYERAELLLERYPYINNAFMAPDLVRGHAHDSPWSAQPWHPEPVSRMCGYGYNEYNASYDEILHAQLPLAAGDEHVMLADINPSLFTDEDWFHGLRHLQVWIRRFDLEARRFDACWALIRTDG